MKEKKFGLLKIVIGLAILCFIFCLPLFIIAPALSAPFDISTLEPFPRFSVADEDTAPFGMAFNTDGTKMFVVGGAGDDINEYTLSTAFEVGTASFVDSFSITDQDTSPEDIAFNTDGTKMFIPGNAGNDINEYTLSAGFDVSTASFVDSFAVGQSETDPTGVTFNTDGTKMYVAGDSQSDILEYALSAGFDVSTASYTDSFNTGFQTMSPEGVLFNTDGTKMFIVSDLNRSVYEYTVSPAFDASAASYVDSFSVSGQESDPLGFAFNTDGTSMFIIGASGDDVNEYTLSTGFDLSTAYYSDGLQVVTEDTVPMKVNFNSDGTKMFVLGGNGKNVLEYNLSRAYDITSASYVDGFSVADEETNVYGLAFSADGTKMFIVGYGGDDVDEYTLSVGFDVSTASFVDSFDISDEETQSYGIDFNTDGTKMFVIGTSGDDVNEYTLSVGFDVSTASFVDSFSVAGQGTNPSGVAFNSTGTRMYVMDNTNRYIFQYNVANSVPSISAGPSDGTSASGTPTDAGSNVTFTTTATDPESDNYYLAVCKTDSITANNEAVPTCGGGNWCVSSSTATGVEASCTYTAQAADAESQDWYVFVCDHNASSLCTSSSQGSGDNGSPFKVNHAPSFTVASDSPDPIKLAGNITFSTTASDSDTDGSADTVTLYVCKAEDFSGGSCGAGGQWCNSTASASDPSCTYTVQAGDGDADQNYYAYVVDNHDFESTGNPISSTFTTDVTAPTITSISSDKANGSYKAGEVIDIDVTFSEAITSTGDVTVTLETGDTDRTCTFAVTNASTGTCNYTVQAGDTSSDLEATISGTIADQVGNSMTNYTPATTLAASKALVIDTTAPTITSVSSSKADGSYKADEVIDIDVTFSENVTSTGNITVTLETGDTDRTCTFSVTDSDTGTCNYTVQAGDTSSDLDATISGTIADGATNALTNYTPATTLAVSKALVVDTTDPVVDAGSNQAKNALFTQDATTSDATSGIASYSWSKVSGPGTITFGTATAEDTTISASVEGTYVIRLTATDNAGNSANDNFSLIWDTTRPTISSISSNKADGSYKAGEVIDIDVTFSESVTSTGDVAVTLETGDTDQTCTFSMSSALTGTCNYTVQVGDTSLDLDATIVGVIKDQTNSLLLNFTPGTSLATNKALIIDTTAPTVSTLSPADNALEVSISADLVITFSEIVNAGTGNITLFGPGSTVVEQFDVTTDISGSGTDTITMNPASNFEGGSGYYVQVDAAAFTDVAGNGYAGIADTTTWSFTSMNTARWGETPPEVKLPPNTGDNNRQIEDENDPGEDGIDSERNIEEEEGNREVTAEDDEGQEESLKDQQDESNSTELREDERLVKLDDLSTVFLVNDTTGEKRYFFNEAGFKDHGYSFDQVEVTTIDDLSQYTPVAPVFFPEDSLVKFSTDPKVYLVTGDNQLEWIPNEEDFEESGYEWNDINVMPDSVYSSFEFMEED